MFGLDKLKQDILLAGIIALALFGAYNYLGSLKSEISKQKQTISALESTIVSKNTDIQKLQGENERLAKDVKMEEDICDIRMSELTFFMEKKLEQANRVNNNKKVTAGKIVDVKNDTSKTAEQKEQAILNIEYDALEASNLFKSLK